MKLCPKMQSNSYPVAAGSAARVGGEKSLRSFLFLVRLAKKINCKCSVYQLYGRKE
jgi:hypothetical protein